MVCAGLRGLLLVAAVCVSTIGAASGAAMAVPEVHRQAVDEQSYPWSSIGKLFNETGASCSGVVIGRDTILTAAHCLYNARSRRFIPPGALHFLVGYRTGRYSVHARIAHYQVGAGFDPQRYDRTSTADWALLTVTEPLPEKIAPLPLLRDAAATGTPAILVGYPQDRAYAMTADRDCALGARVDPGQLLTHTCRGVMGTSGAPILVGSGNDIEVAAIQIATMDSNAGKTMLAVPAQTIEAHISSDVIAPQVEIASVCDGGPSDVWIMDIQARLDPNRLDLSPLYEELPEPPRTIVVASLDAGLLPIALP